MKDNITIEKSDRKAVCTNLKPFDIFSGEDDYVEVTLWTNGEGYDITISSKLGNRTIQVSTGEFNAISALVTVL